jgi:hypothetical protein
MWLDPQAFGRAREVALVGAGALLVLVGGALLVLPGPGLPVLVGGLALLSPRVAWARRALEQIKRAVGRGGGPADPGARDAGSPIA